MNRIDEARRLTEGAILLLEAAGRALQGTLFERLHEVQIGVLRHSLELMESEEKAA